jgi:PAS domain-containing protein
MDVSTNTGQNTMYRDVIYASQSAIMTLTPVSWKYSFANPAALALFGAKTEEEFLTLYPWTLSPETQEDGRYS